MRLLLWGDSNCRDSGLSYSNQQLLTLVKRPVMANYEGSKVKKLFLQAEDKAIQHFSRLVNIDEKIHVKTDVDTMSSLCI